MYAASNRATVNGNIPPPRTAAQVLQEQQLRQTRIQSFLSDNSGPNTMLSQATTSADESIARRQTETARKIDDITAGLSG
ncbi:hypothetical protein CPAR01_06237 [Colletotrichum paranaense]|uniref:Uncharacterized protein n=1 Tax=Colletotrichum paranaense TaxID=1914294 RepID=A0ABQ9STJ7_9PEZI|nr:uncharacterized protein CPAR01_06237 [Colletotrichum paranaense]KAK1542850.1 hypothetical protein CPAR01_06237 [Colletotrichum paranaense]